MKAAQTYVGSSYHGEENGLRVEVAIERPVLLAGRCVRRLPATRGELGDNVQNSA